MLYWPFPVKICGAATIEQNRRFVDSVSSNSFIVIAIQTVQIGGVMVKRQKERLYESSRERKANRSNNEAAATNPTSASVSLSSTIRPLPFSHCALLLTPFENPVCTKQSGGIIFESSALLSYVLEHQKDPVTGAAISTRDIISLSMSRNDENEWCCPVLTKPFSPHIKFVAILHQNTATTTASVYSYEAYQQFNLKTKSYDDLVTGEPFDPNNDLLILYDPVNDAQRRDINSFYHIQNARNLEQKGGGSNRNNPNLRHSLTATRIMDKIDKTRPYLTAQLLQKAPDELHESARYWDETGTAPLRVLAKDVTGVAYTDAATTTSLTSTAVPLHNSNQERDAILEEILQAQFRVATRQLKQKGYVRLFLNCFGDNEPLVLELHCDIVPRTCANFLGLCRNKAYDGSKFHRLIPSFMIQGGKPTPADSGVVEESYWGGSFRDEFDDRLKHSGPGILSMANAGEHTNKRQFFITFKSCPHLDRKHTVFGSVVNENKAELLAKLKMIPTHSATDMPRQDITIVRTEIVDDPMAKAKEMERQRLLLLRRQRQQQQQQHSDNKKTSEDAHASKTITTSTKTKTSAAAVSGSSAVGKYLKLPAIKTAGNHSDDSDKKRSSSVQEKSPPPKEEKDGSSTAIPTAKTTKKAKFGDFSGW
jgi:peptidyl-prolyl cis-trans isomerase-like 2